ncbi:hypothetical protein O6H91_07G093000 [Diphasiastrum complanatum]|uniref:Uncharacterized protein n=3 Tax=Diphasiastrum complanatum TaxID=34168 RepID=A0ACC2D8M7_DIPCM|nr:hypothetical protein O6H91_07G082600 [Diphasiastrum complanatum]KAJ7550094.1 hypothetical protein O6H91_07G082600 [Diphasiastrum complanatum]KAJ7550292.1 hypothetical protein O6H91_07G093000 [Diphasiastrum complanatum]
MKKAISAMLFMVVLFSTTALGRREDERHRERERERQRRGEGGDRFRDLEPRKPKELFRSEGGQIEEWTADEYQALQDADMAAAKITLNPRGLVLPLYIDNHAIKVVVAGTARMGLVLPWGDRGIERYVYRVQKGDVIAVPRGVPTWWYNDGKERTEIVGIADTTSGEQPGLVKPFFLVGGQEGQYGSILRGFDREILARAWDVDEQTVTRLLEDQKGAAIVQVREGIELPEVTEGENTYFANFVYRAKRSEADVRVERGGKLQVVNRYKLPVLRHLDLGMTCVKLEPNAMKAPGWSLNAHNVIYIVRGSGRIQIVRHNGEQALDTEVREGSLVVVPRSFPCAEIAGSDGLDYVSVSTADTPLGEFLAGRNSVYKGIPLEVVARSFNIDDDLERKIRERRTEEAIILPPRSGREHRRRRGDEDEPRYVA